MNQLQDILEVRELREEDIEMIVNYWCETDDEYMIKMGIDLSKLPAKDQMRLALTQQFNLPVEKRQSYALVGVIKGDPVGHCNVNPIDFGQSANMHLHIWSIEHRRKGLGTKLVRQSLPWFFQNLKLRTLICEPYALNPAPHKTLAKLGFKKVKEYITIPGSLANKQPVIRWEMTRGEFSNLYPASLEQIK